MVAKLGLQDSLALVVFLTLIIVFFAAIVRESIFKVHCEVEELEFAVERLEAAARGVE